MPKKLPSPCVDVCKYKRAGHCIACSMTKAQKSMYKQLKTEKHREGFIQMLMAQQESLGKFPAWRGMYEKRCAKKGAKLPKILLAEMR
ncbi:MAG: DUF1289 domain-containing protein [Pseudomonadota bacterium]